MKQQNWIYRDNRGQKHHVGVMHGADSGNLMIHCNSRVIVIDFQVLDNKTYNFYINKSLCTISIIKHLGQYKYDLEVEDEQEKEEVDVPVRHIKKGVDWKKIGLFGIFIGFFSLIIVFSILLNKNMPKGNLQTAVAKVYNDEKFPFQLVYQFKDENNRLIRSYTDLSNLNIEDEAILPIEDGDEFFVIYAPNDSDQNSVLFRKPTPNQLELYKNRIIEVHIAKNPQLSRAEARCLIDQVYKYAALDGLANIYYQDNKAQENFPYGSSSYNEMMKNEDLLVLLRDFCE